MLAALLLSAITIRPPQSSPPPPPEKGAVVDERTEIATALDQLRAKVRAREWKTARAGLDALLLRFEGSAIVRGKLIEIEEILRLCEFWSKHPAPPPKDLLYGELVYYTPATDAVKLLYAPGRMMKTAVVRAKRIPKLESGFGAAPSSPVTPAFPDFEQLGFVSLHPLQFNGPYTVDLQATIRSGQTYVPLLFFVLEEDEVLRLSLEGRLRLERVDSRSGATTLAWSTDTVVTEGKKFSLSVEVRDATITAKVNGRSVLSAPKKKDQFGWFGVAGFERIDTLTLTGKSYGQWLDALVDAAVLDDRKAFDASFDARKVLPPWIYDVPNKAARDADGEKAAVELVQVLFSKAHNEAIGKLSGASQWTALLELVQKSTAKQIPALANAWLRATAFFGLDRLTEAREAATIVCTAAPKHREMRTMSLLLSLRLDPVDAAVAHAREFVRDFPDDVLGRRLLVKLLQRSGSFDAAQSEAEFAFAAGLDRTEMEKLVLQARRAASGPVFRTSSRYESKHFAVTSDMDRETCMQIARTLEESNECFAALIGPLPEPRPSMRAFVFSGRQAYLDYCEDLVLQPLTQTQGMFVGDLSQLVMWNPVDRAEFATVVRHEGFHQFVHELVPEMPTWLNEGLAQYFQTARREKKGWATGAVPKGAFKTIADLGALPAEKLENVALERLFDLEPSGFYGASMQFCYAYSWCIVHTLAHGTPEDRARFDALIKKIYAGQDGAAAVNEALQGVDLIALRARVIEHAKSME